MQLILNGRETFGLVEDAEMKNQQEELHKLREVLSLAKEDLKRAYKTNAGLFVYVCVLTLGMLTKMYVCTILHQIETSSK